MATPDSTQWELKPHTAAKHRILQRYLQAWYPILGRDHDNLLVIDGFAGPGLYSKGERGSPLIAIDAAERQNSYIRGEVSFVFVEKRRDRFEALDQIVKNLPSASNLNIVTRNATFGEIFPNLLSRLERSEDVIPTFAFIDPFGFSDAPMSLIHRLLDLEKAEVLTNFAVESVNRFKEHPENNIREHISSLLGKAVSEIDFNQGDDVETLRRVYQTALEGKAKYVRSFEMFDENNRPIYDLFFASNGPQGHEKMKEAMWEVDEEGRFRFSDATNPRQEVLFSKDPAPQLLKMVMHEFGQQGTVQAGEIRQWVTESTAFLQKHCTQALKLGEDQHRYLVRETKADGKKRHFGFPENVIIDFDNPPGKQGVLL